MTHEKVTPIDILSALCERCLSLCQLVVPILQMRIMRLRKVRDWTRLKTQPVSGMSSDSRHFALPTSPPLCALLFLTNPKGVAAVGSAEGMLGSQKKAGGCALRCGVGRSWELHRCLPPLPHFSCVPGAYAADETSILG